jgi:hypothetical protein
MGFFEQIFYTDGKIFVFFLQLENMGNIRTWTGHGCHGVKNAADEKRACHWI